ncbi:hypothetical protein CJD36_020060 [Flavipsychrobacter stenotrophus]|uniref:Uncharacterized protein n=2 Tax=Flavipsychrobacter stenotrophus TaxID=2077091 RepID=A0A2S7SSF5_9BACT|nr:hypothetical protein CJD36_020060 [Flavipsychrobacter stenotrophus]
METFKSRLQELLSAENLTVPAFAIELGYDNPEKIYRLMRDENNKPSFDILQAISNKFVNWNLNWVVTGKGNKHLTPVTNGSSETIIGSNQPEPTPANSLKLSPKLSATPSPTPKNREYTPSNNNSFVNESSLIYGAKAPQIITINEHGIDNIVYVPVKARAGYLLGNGDQEYISDLPTFRMPGLNHSTYRMFETEGVSMAPTLSDRDRVIGQWVENFDNIRENRIHVVVTRSGVLVKRVLNRLKERGKIYLKSDTISHRHDHPIIEIDPEDIQELWYVNMKVSSDLSEPAEIYERVSELELNQQLMMKKLGIETPRLKQKPSNDV